MAYTLYVICPWKVLEKKGLRSVWTMFALLVVCEVLSFVCMLPCTMCTSSFIMTAGLNVPWWPELYTIMRFKYFRWQNVFINRPCSTKLAIGMLDELWSLTSKDRLGADRAKIRTVIAEHSHSVPFCCPQHLPPHLRSDRGPVLDDLSILVFHSKEMDQDLYGKALPDTHE